MHTVAKAVQSMVNIRCNHCGSTVCYIEKGRAYDRFAAILCPDCSEDDHAACFVHRYRN